MLVAIKAPAVSLARGPFQERLRRFFSKFGPVRLQQPSRGRVPESSPGASSSPN